MNTKVTKLQAQQLLAAAVLGTNAFLSGKPRVPAHDKDLMDMLRGRGIGQTPKGEASSIELMKMWLNNWDLANLNN